MFSCSARDLPDEVLPVTDEELVLFEAMNQKEKEAFVRQRLAEYRVELAREPVMGNEGFWKDSCNLHGQVTPTKIPKQPRLRWSKLSRAKAQEMINGSGMRCSKYAAR